MGIMQLVEKGLIRVEDNVSKYISNVPHGDKITIHNLLTHTSGLKNYTNLSNFLLSDTKNKDPMVMDDCRYRSWKRNLSWRKYFWI